MNLKTKLGMIFLLIMIFLTACNGYDGVDECSISKEEIENPSEDAVAYTIHNQSCTTISTIYVTPKKCDYWGIDWSGMSVLHPGESFSVFIPKGRYDIHFEDAVGDPYYFYNQKIKEGGELFLSNADGTSMDECQASVTLVNQSDKAITGFFIHSNGGMNWLGDGSILPGESFQFLMFPSIYDLLVVFGDNSTFFKERTLYLEEDVLVDHHIIINVTGD